MRVKKLVKEIEIEVNKYDSRLNLKSYIIKDKLGLIPVLESIKYYYQRVFKNGE